MSIGDDFKHAFNEMVDIMGCTVLIHKNWGTPHQQTFEVRGLKNNEKNRRDKVMFQFPEALDIQVGDILQQKGARDLWRVTDIEDDIHDDVYVNFEAKVEKFSGEPTPKVAGGQPARASSPSQVVIHGSVYGGIQLHSPNATQNISVQMLQVDENVQRLRDLLQKAPIADLDREEALLALDRIGQLARKERTPDVVGKIKGKLELVKATFDVAKDIAQVAAPYIGAIAQVLCQ
jgi:hypothetical protein